MRFPKTLSPTSPQHVEHRTRNSQRTTHNAHHTTRNTQRTRHIIQATYINYSLKIGSSVIPATDCIKILGVSLDSMLNLNKHISNTCRTVYNYAPP